MIATVHLLHERLSLTCLFFTFAMGLWAAYLILRNRGADGAYLGAIVVGELLLVAQALLGLWLYLDAGIPLARGLHVLYGLLAVLMWPFIYTFTRSGDGGRRESILFAATAFFLWLLLARAVETASL